MLKKIGLIIFVVLLGYKGWQTFSPGQTAGSTGVQLAAVYEKPYVVVYGRDTCGWTQDLREELDAQRVAHIYKLIDEASVSNELYPRMTRSGLDTRLFELPVVDVNGKLYIRPSLQKVLDEYKQK